ncbi:unnamed protein product [Cylicocyclus nassatus]|uniref:Uncharacterized protein n=1 Tax=Cylicocyclus nassatus TaxID=53992 RepID=A0AA36H1W5_CYLNA|nr:unnamed protein product [Cylicocyclus nassatus]
MIRWALFLPVASHQFHCNYSSPLWEAGIEFGLENRIIPGYNCSLVPTAAMVSSGGKVDPPLVSLSYPYTHGGDAKDIILSALAYWDPKFTYYSECSDGLGCAERQDPEKWSGNFSCVFHIRPSTYPQHYRWRCRFGNNA